jgi:hypothetical protein
MMDFLMSGIELEAMCGLPYIQQVAYMRGIRPYMDLKTGIVGIKRGISYQSIAEQLYIEPHQGIKSESLSRDQVRRAIAGLVRVGLVSVQSKDMRLILKCELAKRDYFVQNKAAINPPCKATTIPSEKNLLDTGFFGVEGEKGDIGEVSKAATPLNNNYLYILSQKFEKFWWLYPEKKSREPAFEIFKQINPDEELVQTMLQALDKQIQARVAKEAKGEWVPPWKYPANWLAQKCWEDEVKIELTKEIRHAKRRSHTETTTSDPFWNSESGDGADFGEGEYEPSNIINLQRYQQQ